MYEVNLAAEGTTVVTIILIPSFKAHQVDCLSTFTSTGAQMFIGKEGPTKGTSIKKTSRKIMTDCWQRASKTFHL